MKGAVRGASEQLVKQLWRNLELPHIHQGVRCASPMCLARVSPPPCNTPFLSACLTRLTCRTWSLSTCTPHLEELNNVSFKIYIYPIYMIKLF